MRIIFMGTSDFAVPTLEALIASDHCIVGVCTQAPKPKGRGYHVQKSPVHLLAERHTIPVFTPRSLRSEDLQTELKALEADVGVVAAYGLILPKAVLQIPPLGFLNVHGSLLPRWRGAAPIHRAVMAGDQTTGVTIMKMDEGLDTGPMISQIEVPIKDTTTVAELHSMLALLGAQLLVDVVGFYPCGNKAQPQEGVTYAHKLMKRESFLDWSLSGAVLKRYIRALNPWPGAVFTYDGQDIKILDAEVVSMQSGAPGEIIDERLLIQCTEDALRPLILQKPGKAPLALKDFLNGTKIPKGTRLAVRTPDAPL